SLGESQYIHPVALHYGILLHFHHHLGSRVQPYISGPLSAGHDRPHFCAVIRCHYIFHLHVLLDLFSAPQHGEDDHRRCRWTVVLSSKRGRHPHRGPNVALPPHGDDDGVRVGVPGIVVNGGDSDDPVFDTECTQAPTISVLGIVSRALYDGRIPGFCRAGSRECIDVHALVQRTDGRRVLDRCSAVGAHIPTQPAGRRCRNCAYARHPVARGPRRLGRLR
ncbi:hypothetical protein HK405_000982, partial [Cladochytrium tenue]